MFHRAAKRPAPNVFIAPFMAVKHIVLSEEKNSTANIGTSVYTGSSASDGSIGAKMANYITKKDQERMAQILYDFWAAMDQNREGTMSDTLFEAKKNRLLNEFYKFTDKIIVGVINSPQYAYYRYAEMDDLVNYARMKIYESILARQWKAERGNIFNFFTTVAARNLRSFTMNITKKKRRMVSLDMTAAINDSRFIYQQDFDKNINVDFAFNEMESFFEDKKKLLKLLEVFKEYYSMNVGKKFIKKNFIEYAKSYCFSRSFVNTFFNYCKKIKSVSSLMGELDATENKK